MRTWCRRNAPGRGRKPRGLPRQRRRARELPVLCRNRPHLLHIVGLHGIEVRGLGPELGHMGEVVPLNDVLQSIRVVVLREQLCVAN